ncbi:hypothetical protein JJB09_10930 [Rhizobium sp. KVB221]|uniref:Uncharacterized protein n=1 Tax=Rhizobium setariae TaxID=2801340 RepID=A0A936YT78_9HYPH|nr:hypothetical protein [Rhizobium setariae]MBL0372541.1 hypothetical protein [Rhizobium setariae]
MFDLIKRNLLKIVMLADGVVSLVAGTALTTFSSAIAGLFGPALPAIAVLGIGLFLLGWGVFHLAAGRAERISGRAVRIAIAGDAAWVAASAALLAIGWNGLSSLGVVAIAVLAIAVADIMLLKMVGLNARQTAVNA